MSMKSMMNDFIAKLEFRRASRIKLDKDYQFMLDISNPTAFSVRVLKKKFEGVIIEYTNIEFGDDGQFHFDANVIANPNLKNVESKAFRTFTSDIMRGIITESVRHAEKIINENGTLDSVESIEERAVYAEDDSVSEERVSKRKS